jgi:excisionase family DNA binding protein
MPFQGTSMPETGTGSPVQRNFRVAEVAARFDVNATTVYREIKAGRLKAVRIGAGRGTVRVPAEALAEYEASIAAAALVSPELSVETPLGTVDLVAVDRARAGHPVSLNAAETALVALLTSRALAEVA